MNKEQRQRTLDQLERWRQDILDLSRRNRLLYYRPLKTGSLEIISPEPAALVARLREHGDLGWSFEDYTGEEFADAEPPLAEEAHERDSQDDLTLENSTDLLVTDRHGASLLRSLRSLARTAEQQYMDTGLWVLYLGIGLLHWVDVDGTEADSPIVLWPVAFERERPSAPFRMVRADEDPATNPALVLKLAEFGIDVSLPDDVNENSLGPILDAFDAATRDQAGWYIDQRVVAGAFSFQKEVMYRDLERNADAIADHPLVAGLALGAEAPESLRADFDLIPEDELEEAAPPEDLTTVLDADSSQRQCVIAARAGQSFIIDGPPGTGKSQTIANVIAELIRGGKAVLFVSEKAAALEVVHSRLSSLGLGDFTLELHSHKSSRREVAKSLADSMAAHPSPGTQFPASDVVLLRQRRRSLNAYARAINEVREPLQMSVHAAIGRIAALGGVPTIAVPDVEWATLTPAVLAQVRELGGDLGRAWGPIGQGEAFVWRDLTDEAKAVGRRGEWADAVSQARERLSTLIEEAEILAQEFRVPWDRTFHDAGRLVELAGLLAEEYRGINAAWLEADDLASITRLVDGLQRLQEARVACRESLATDGINDPASIDPNRLRSAEQALQAARAAGWPVEPSTSLASLREWAERGRTHSAQMSSASADAESLDRLANLLQGSPPSLLDAEFLANLGRLAGSATPPEGRWLDDGALANARRTSTRLKDATEAARKARAELEEFFNDGIFDVDLVGLRIRFEQVHKGVGKLWSAYRADKKLLASLTRTGRADDAAVARLSDALEAKKKLDELEAAEREAGPWLGTRYGTGRDTDFERLEAALGVAGEAIAARGSRRLSDASVELIAATDPGKSSEAAGLARALSERADRLRAVEGSADALAIDVTQALHSCAAELDERVAALQLLIDALALGGGDPSVEWVMAVLLKRAELEEVLTEADGKRTEWGQHLGQDVDLGTDIETLRADLAWVGRVRSIFGGPLTESESASILEAGAPTFSIEDALSAWRASRDALLRAFLPDARTRVGGDLDSAFADAEDLLTLLGESVDTQIDEWTAFDRASNDLVDMGFAESLRGLIEQEVAADQVAGALESALLAGWIDSLLLADADRLRPDLLSLRRDDLVAEFRRLDRDFVAHSAATVIDACRARRPRTNAGAAGLIAREGEKKRRHMPVRTLLSQTAGVPQALKPCFMMSPLSVSQFLPPDLRFDTVIFDEASQVNPADAINCIYRGNQLIIAGDQRQLPPTSFFDRLGADDGDEYEEGQFEEFDSVLDLAKGSGVLRSLTLQWHYRSQHESLIAYSNYGFYEGRLITFPGAVEEDPALGVSLMRVDGVYARGGARDNRVEAAAVADRVAHYRSAYPQLSIGVVAFSTNQATAIELELDKRRRLDPLFDALYDGDRLTGFFVKNLESVQGDERDVIIFSIGYGPDESGRLTMNFGPLNGPTGHRRLNVAITRARRRIDIVSSIGAEDIPLTVEGLGVRHLRGYLDFAARGMDALALDLVETGRDADSEFEVEVANVIRSWGYDAVPQVGSAGYRIDIAVRDPSKPGRFVLGVECDGFMYHSSKVARDRDRLRQDVLEGLGWRIHRIWSTGWYRNRGDEEAALRMAIDDAIAAGGVPVEALPGPVEAGGRGALAQVNLDDRPAVGRPYETFEVRKTVSGAFESDASVGAISQAITDVVRVEQPASQETVFARVRTGWGVARATAKVRRSFEAALDLAIANSRVIRGADGFLRIDPDIPATPRHPVGLKSTHRRVRDVAPAEIQSAVLAIATELRAVTIDDLSRQTALFFGWNRRGPDITRALGKAIESALGSAALVADEDGWIHVASDNGTDELSR